MMSKRKWQLKEQHPLLLPQRKSSQPLSQKSRFEIPNGKKENSDLRQPKVDKCKDLYSIFSAKADDHKTHTSPIVDKERSRKPSSPVSLLNYIETKKNSKNETNRRSNFVPCPLQCGKHIALQCLNAHLDICDSGTTTNDGSPSAPNKSVFLKGRISHDETNEAAIFSGLEDESHHEEKQIVSVNNDSSNEHEVASLRDKNQGTPSSLEPIQSSNIQHNHKSVHHFKNPGYENVFEHMMKRSQAISTASIPIRQHFHLNCVDENYAMSWSTVEGSTIPKTSTDASIAWSTTTIIKAPRQNLHDSQVNENNNDRTDVMYRDIELIVSSSVPSDTDNDSESDKLVQTDKSINQEQSDNNTKRMQKRGHRIRLVQKHSSLSVALLKSMLQKNIRRRRPLPSVRVAMELADKSWSDLIRRIPIIILEDSTLHPDMPYIVWLMVADSKGFVPPKKMIIRVMEIIFEVASCPWKDETVVDPSNEKESAIKTDNLPLHLNLVEFWQPAMEQSAELSLRAMLLRSQYGGMACDIKMLTNCVQMWRKRFQEIPQFIPPDFCKRWMIPNHFSQDSVTWVNLPKRLHQVWKTKSEKYVRMVLFANHPFLEKLNLTDMCLAGVDFHCCNIIETVLLDAKKKRGDNQQSELLYDELHNRLTKFKEKFHNEETGHTMKVLSDKDELKQKEYVLEFTKSCMWKYRSAINLRKPLLLPVKYDLNRTSHDIDKTKELWDGILQVPVENFALEYLRKRLL